MPKVADSPEESFQSDQSPVPNDLAKYILPADAKSCPYDTCSYHGKEFSPHWRLNEHMKLKHGWPRRMTQPFTDKRKHGQQRSKAYRYTKSSIRTSEPSQFTWHSGPDSPSIASPEQMFSNEHELKGLPNRLTLSSSNPLDPLHLGHGHPISAEEIATISSDVNKILQSDDMISDEDSALSSLPTSPSSNEPGLKESDKDELMVFEIQAYIAFLKTAASSNDGKAANYTEMAAGLQTIMDASKIRVNTFMSSKEAQTLSSLYKCLSTRANAKAQLRTPSNTMNLPNRPVSSPRVTSRYDAKGQAQPAPSGTRPLTLKLNLTPSSTSSKHAGK